MLDIKVFTQNTAKYEESFLASAYGKSPVALYGTGLIAKAMVCAFSKVQIVGILDRNSDNIGKKFCNLPVISLEEAIQSVKAIIIAADSQHWKVIFERISYLKKRHGIELFFADGTIANPEFFKEYEEEKTVIQYSVAMSIDVNDIKKAIEQSEVISFDLFDTLLMRKIVKPSDLFDLWEIKVVQRHPDLRGISFARNEAATKAFADFGDCYRLEQVYEHLGKQYKLSPELLHELMELEYQLELDCIVPRKEMVNCFYYALNMGKTVNLISDMYLPVEVIKGLLEKCGITGYHQVYISSEVGKSKSSGAFWEHYATEFNGRKCFHLGDNEQADIVGAKAYGINAVRVMSGTNMLGCLPFGKMLNNVNSTYDSVVAGLFAAKIFNSPFALKATDGKIVIDRFFDYGYLFFGPVIVEYLLWLIHQFIDDKPDKVLFFARDGYLLEKLYNKLIKRLGREDLPEGIYFKTSRRLASVAGIHTSNDALNLLTHYFQGTPYSLLYNRFGVDCPECPDDEVITNRCEEAHNYVEKFMPEILKNAQDERNAYLKYLEQTGATKCKSIAVCDYLTRGTIQFWLNKLIKTDINGYYMVRYGEDEFNYDLDSKMKSVYRCISNEELNVGNYRIMESVLSAPEGCYLRANDDGSFVNSEASNNLNQFSFIEEVHQGIESFMNDLLEIYDAILETPLNKELANAVFGIMTESYCHLSNAIVSTFNWNSEFSGLTNRTKIIDMA